MGELHRRRSWPVGFTTETSFDNFQSCGAGWAALLRHFCLDMGDQRDDIIRVTKPVLAAPRKRMATLEQIPSLGTVAWGLRGPWPGGMCSRRGPARLPC